jgi:hypothetical protein
MVEMVPMTVSVDENDDGDALRVSALWVIRILF